MNKALAFGTTGMDRAAHLRAAPPAPRRVLILCGGQVSAHADGLIWHAPDDLPHGDDIFLGLDAEGPFHARDVAEWPAEGLRNLRDMMTQLAPAEAERAATARALIHWHRSHRFCSACGHPSDMTQGGWQRLCPACGTSHFPRTDPVVIMLILHGERLLLGRSPGWAPGMHSCLAGFMEPGETPETAVRREAMEETGVRVGPVRYLISQPWPFPASLMLGCVAQAESTDITLDPEELEAARWADKHEVMEAIIGRHPDLVLPQPGTIARHLITRWLADDLD